MGHLKGPQALGAGELVVGVPRSGGAETGGGKGGGDSGGANGQGAPCGEGVSTEMSAP